MSRYTYFDENEDEKIIIKDGCKYKTNGICYCNRDWIKLGKKCHSEGNCVHFLMEKEVDE